MLKVAKLQFKKNLAYLYKNLDYPCAKILSAFNTIGFSITNNINRSRKKRIFKRRML